MNIRLPILWSMLTYTYIKKPVQTNEVKDRPMWTGENNFDRFNVH